MITAASAADIVAKERARRRAAWDQAFAAAEPDRRAAIAARAHRDEILWYDLETFALRLAREPAGFDAPRPRAPRLAEALASVETTARAARDRAIAGRMPQGEALALLHLRDWLAARRPHRLADIAASAQRAAA